MEDKNHKRLGNPMSLGFLGGSVYSNIGYTHFCASGLDGLWRLKAGSLSRDNNKNSNSGKIYNICDQRIYSNWKEMLEKEVGDLDAVVILSPSNLHFEMVEYALKLNYPVICEKPLASNLDELEVIINLQKNLNAFIAVTYNYTGYPMIRLLKKIISDYILGEIFHFQIEMPQETYLRCDSNNNPFFVEDWRKKDHNTPTINFDLAVHMHQIIFYLLGEYPKSVVAHEKNHNKNFDIIDNVNCLTEYSNGLDGHFWWSKSSLGNRNGLKIRIFGSEGSACWIQEKPELLYLSYKDGRKETIDRGDSRYSNFMKTYHRFKAGHPSGFVEAFANIYKDLYICLNQFLSEKDFSSKELFGTNMSKRELMFFNAIKKSIETRSFVDVICNSQSIINN
ncbi:MAG: oxidoreductase [Candidatus Marinimicrobia bacterium]|nr:oxidoreductase [Candidatus Neomarinimicrobiota bacterium]